LRRAWIVAPNAGDGADSGCEDWNVVEHGERDEVVRAAGIVLATLAGPDQDAMAEESPNWPTWM
jgi:hypothetical protein